MVPHIAKEGRSFKGAGLYYLHDKGALTSERVAFTHVENLHTAPAEKAFKEMAWVALRAKKIKEQAETKSGGRKQENPVFHYSLAWHPEQEPTREAMIEAGRASLKTLELEGYQAVMVAHADEPHKHLHIIVNRVHPDTGKMANIDFGKMRLSRWAEAYEKEHGKIYCAQRVENNEQRRQGQYVKYRDPVIATAWRHADNGRAFVAALLEQGYLLCMGDRRDFVVMDAQGKVHNPARHIEGVKVKDIRAKLADLSKEQLPGLEEARARHEAIQTARKERAAARGEKTPTRTGWIQRPEPERITFQNKLQWQHIEERAALAGAHQEEREAKAREIRSVQRSEETRRELAEIEARRKAQGFKALLRQLRGDEEARDRAEALQQMLARDEAILEGALKVIDEEYARKKRDLERRHEAEKQGRFEYERVKEDRPPPTRQGGTGFTPAPHMNLRPRMAPGYGRPTADERQAR
ncbi:MAG: relaxase/mobilization nuclease domain-containing protein, partial [Candidatus Competibacteraceae bacterium]